MPSPFGIQISNKMVAGQRYRKWEKVQENKKKIQTDLNQNKALSSGNGSSNDGNIETLFSRVIKINRKTWQKFRYNSKYYSGWRILVTFVQSMV